MNTPQGPLESIEPHQRSLLIRTLEGDFAFLMKKPTEVAQTIKKIKETCPHIHHRVTDNGMARYCSDCGEYFQVCTDFSEETEAWFAREHEKAIANSPMHIIPAEQPPERSE